MMTSSESPLVSVLINAYNEERFIGAAIDSAIAQTHQNLEIIVLDDGSTDRTPEIVKGYDDSRVRYIRENRLGLVGGRNKLLQEAKGKYLTWLDSDDIYLPNKVEEEVDFLETHLDYAAAYCNMKYFWDGAPDVFYHHRVTLYAGDIFDKLLERIFITNTAFMMRRSVVEQLGIFRTDLGIVEDWEYFLRMARAGMKFGFLDKDLVRYRLRRDSHSNFKRQVDIKSSEVKIFENVKQELSSTDQARYHIDRWLAKRKENLFVALLCAGRRADAKRCFQEIMPYLGFVKKAVFLLMFMVPTAILGWAIERVFQYRKEHYFLPIS